MKTTDNGQEVALRQHVTSGAVALDPAVGAALRKTLREQLDQVESWLDRTGALARPPALGANPVSDAMTAKFTGRVNGEGHSFIGVMIAYKAVLEQTLDSVSTAIQNFEQVDDDHREALKKISGS